MRAESIIYHYQHKGDQAIIDREFFWTLGTLLSPFEGVFIIDPNGPRKKKEASKPPKGVMREHEGGEFIPYHSNIQG